MPSPAVNFEAELDAALRQAPRVQPPAHFRNRLLARIPETVDNATRDWWVPSLIAIGIGLVPAAGAAAVLRLGLSGWLVQPYVLAALLGVETVAALAWLWRTFRAS